MHEKENREGEIIEMVPPALLEGARSQNTHSIKKGKEELGQREVDWGSTFLWDLKGQVEAGGAAGS